MVVYNSGFLSRLQDAGWKLKIIVKDGLQRRRRRIILTMFIVRVLSIFSLLIYQICKLCIFRYCNAIFFNKLRNISWLFYNELE